MVDEKILDKLRKLLALAGSENEYEAALALSKAQAIMDEYNIRVVDVALDGSGATIKDQVSPLEGERFLKWEQFLAVSIASAFDGRLILKRGIFLGETTGYHFIAAKTDLAIILDLFERLRQTIRHKSKDYLKQHRYSRGQGRTAANSYRIGMTMTINKRLKQLRSNSGLDTENQYGMTGRELVAVKNAAVEQRIQKLYPHLRNAKKSHSNIDPTAYQQGERDGHSVSLHRSMPNGQGPLSLAA